MLFTILLWANVWYKNSSFGVASSTLVAAKFYTYSWRCWLGVYLEIDGLAFDTQNGA